MAYFGDPRYVGWGGGLLVTLEGQVIVSVAVSGLPEHEDMELAFLGSEATLATRDASPGTMGVT